ncbi:MAG TPA: tetratricopeptide repeat protein [Myxococcaceae bacterium]|nr:tetratricopeptide repeat protein [Myxococcaceae bacterium]
MLSPHAQQGFSLLQAGKADDGIRAFKEGLQADPRDVDCLLGLARVALIKGLPDEAKPFLAQITMLQPLHAEAGSHLALIRFMGGDKSALAHLRQATITPTAGAFEFMNLARALGRSGDNAASEVAYKRAVLLDPKNAFIRMEAGDAALARGDGPSAVAHFGAAVESAPHEYILVAHLAKAHAVNGDIPKAAEWMQKAIDIAPLEPALREEMYLLRMRTGDHAGALAQVEELLKRAPEEPQYRYWKGVSLIRLCRLEDAKVEFESVVAARPKASDARQALADVYAQLKDYPRAQKLLEEALQLDPTSAPAAIDLSNLLFEKGAPGKAQAEKVLRQALVSHPEEPALHFNLAVALASSDKKKALDHAQKSVAFSRPDWGVRAEAERLVQALSAPPQGKP